VIDLFGGVGGNSIAFALSSRWSQVIAIEKDASTIACGQRNAEIYGVADQITWINDDCFSYLSMNSNSIDTSKTVIFASPPWGGVAYRGEEIFDLNTMQPYSAEMIHSASRGMDCALYLPRTSDLRQIAKLAPEEKKIDVVQYCVEGMCFTFPKLLSIVIPKLFKSPVLILGLIGASKALVAYVPAPDNSK
jgi:trimethylguanosine synthase